MLCEICAAEEAAFTIIPVAEGMPQTLGPACYARSGLEFAKAVLPAEEIAATLGPLFVAPNSLIAGETRKDAKRRKTPPPTHPGTDQEGPTEGPPEEPTAAADA